MSIKLASPTGGEKKNKHKHENEAGHLGFQNKLG